MMYQELESLLHGINTFSSPSDLRITDIKYTHITKAPMDCVLLKIETNSDLVGYGEVRDWGSPTYAMMLKSRLIVENPCDVDKLFRRIKQFGNHGRQGGGVSGIEVALWDLAGKAYGVPVYRMIGGKFRDKVRMYCDTDVDGKPDGITMGKALQKRIEQGYGFVKMDLGITHLLHEKDALSAPLGFLNAMRALDPDGYKESNNSVEYMLARNKVYDLYNISHPFTAIHVTEKGFDILEQYIADVRSIIGYEVPLAIDHFGHIGIDDCIKLSRRIEKYNPAWLEDMLPWQLTDQYVRLNQSTTIPICTGEDIYLKEHFKPLLESGGVAVIHPDLLTAGGILETKKIGDMAQENGVAMAIHMAESPIACIAAAHTAVATENFLALEFHSNDIPWWNDLVEYAHKPIVDHGYITLSEEPGLGIRKLNDEVIGEHLKQPVESVWVSTEQWNSEWAHDRLWS